MDKDELFRLYVTEQKTAKEIAAIVGTRSPQTVLNWLRKHGIKARGPRAAQRVDLPTRDELYNLYIVQGQSIDAISRARGSSEITISRLLDEYGIPKRPKTAKFGGWNKGKPLPEAQRQHLSEIAKRRTGEKSSRYGAKLNDSTRERISASLRGRFRGAENPFWKGGTKARRDIWQSRFEYKDWRKAVFARDGYTCQMCGKPSNGDIQAHHILPWRNHPEMRFDVGNGITLCIACHQSIKGKEDDYAARFQRVIHQSTP